MIIIKDENRTEKATKKDKKRIEHTFETVEEAEVFCCEELGDCSKCPSKRDCEARKEYLE